MAGRYRFNSLPQMQGSLRVSADAWEISRSDRLAISESVVPSPMRQCAVSRPSSVALGVAEGGAGKPRDDLPPADREQVAHQRQALLRPAVRCARPNRASPIGRSIPPAHRGSRRHIRHRPRRTRCGGPGGRRRPGRPAKSQKNGKGVFEPHSSPMNSIGIAGASSMTARAASIAAVRALPSSRSPSGRLPIWSWFCRKLMKAIGESVPLGSPRGPPRNADISP